MKTYTWLFIIGVASWCIITVAVVVVVVVGKREPPRDGMWMRICSPVVKMSGHVEWRGMSMRGKEGRACAELTGGPFGALE